MERNPFSAAKEELITRFSKPIQFLTRASEDEIVGMFSEPYVEGLEDYIKEKAHTYNLDLHEINSYTPYRSFYYGLVRLARPNVVVETGVWYGASTAFILEALENNGKGELYSIDLPNTRYREDNGRLTGACVGRPENTGVLVPPNLRNRWHLILGKSQEKLTPLLNSLGEIDVFIHDSEHTYDAMMFEFQTAFEFLRCGGVLISDDVHYNGAFQDFVRQQRCSSLVFHRRQGENMGAIVK